MINIRELRNNNWVANKNRVEMYVKFTGESEVYLDFDGNEADVWETSAKDIIPIPFTTEWAQRFGLIGRIINGLCISESEYQGHEYDLCLYDEHTWDSERRVICPIYHVHQCQNIFLDLAGHIIE